MSNLIVREFNGQKIEQRDGDGYMDATAMCKATGKKWAQYWRNQDTQDFVKALAVKVGKTIESMLEVQSGRRGGTYVHPKLAMHLAQWCSPQFAVEVSGWVLDILTTGGIQLHHQPVDPVLAMLDNAKATYLKQIELQKQLNTVEQNLAITQAASRQSPHRGGSGPQDGGQQYRLVFGAGLLQANGARSDASGGGEARSQVERPVQE